VQSSQLAGWNAGPLAWQANPLRPAIEQETLLIPPASVAPWHARHEAPLSANVAAWCPDTVFGTALSFTTQFAVSRWSGPAAWQAPKAPNDTE
jgi:hypothetical protein